MRGEVRVGWEAGGWCMQCICVHCGGVSSVRAGHARGGAHHEHVLHACDAGRVEAQRLVERRRHFLPSIERRAQRCGARCVWGRRRERVVQCICALRRREQRAQGTRGGAHGEHAAHVFDARRVEAQRPVEGRCALPSRNEGMTMRGRGACGAEGGRMVQCICALRRRGQRARRARGGAHVEHVAHVCDAGCVEARRLVERRRLPSIERRA